MRTPQELLNIDYLLKLQFTCQMVMLTVAICLTPTAVNWLTQKHNRATRVIVETSLFVGLILGFSVWLFGISVLGLWIIPTALLILLLEIGGHIVEHYKFITLNRLADEVTLKSQAEDIEKMFRIELALYIPIPLIIIIMAIASWFYNQTPKETLLLCVKFILLLDSLFLLIFLTIEFLRLSDLLFENSNESSPQLKKEKKSFINIVKEVSITIYRLVAPQQFKKNSKEQAINLACMVSDLRKIYLYDAIHNVLLLIALVGLFIWLSKININPIWGISGLFGTVFFFNLFPYIIGQTALHEEILKQYKGMERIELAKNLREYSPRFPFLNSSSSSRSNHSPTHWLSLWEFLFNKIWNNKLEEIIRILQKMAEQNPPKYDLQGSTIYGFAPETKGSVLVSGQNVENNEIVGTKNIYQSEQKQTLAEAAAEIQQLLKQLSQTYPTSTNKERMAVVAEAVDQIEHNPTLKGKVINALKAGGTEAFKEAINHPLVNILIATIEGWKEAE